MQNIIKSPWIVAILTLGAFIGAFFLDFIKDTAGEDNMFYGALFAFALAVVAIIIVAMMSKMHIVQEYSQQVDILKGFIDANGLGQIINENTIENIEKNADSIWVFTLDMSNDLGSESKNRQDNKVFEAVKHNLAEGKKYIYFLPDTPQIHGAIEEYIHVHSYKPEQVEFCMIPYDEFHFISEVVIYNADSSKKSEAMEWFPSKSLNYYFKLDDEYRRSIIGIAKRLLKKYGNG